MSKCVKPLKHLAPEVPWIVWQSWASSMESSSPRVLGSPRWHAARIGGSEPIIRVLNWSATPTKIQKQGTSTWVVPIHTYFRSGLSLPNHIGEQREAVSSRTLNTCVNKQHSVSSDIFLRDVYIWSGWITICQHPETNHGMINTSYQYKVGHIIARSL